MNRLASISKVAGGENSHFYIDKLSINVEVEPSLQRRPVERMSLKRSILKVLIALSNNDP